MAEKKIDLNRSDAEITASGVNQINEELDCIGLFCPEPLFQTRSAIDEIETGEILHVMADDPASEEDIARFCKRTGHNLLKFEEIGGIFHFYIEKK